MRFAPMVRRASLSALFLGAVVVLGGCRTGSPLHDRYNDFRAYYNAYYNASRVMEEGERQLDRPDQTLDRTRFVSIFPEGTGGRTTQFSEAIEKSSELLRHRATSKWADDALFIIGKAYFYQENVVGAEQKFRETIQLAEARGNDRLADEARLWLGRTLGLAQRYEEGAAVLQDRLALTEGNRRDQARLRLILGELFARAERYDEAADALRTGIPDERDADTAARALLLLGQVEEQRGQFDAAADAYRDAADRQPAYELEYAASLSRALVLALDAGRQSEGLELIRRMRRDDKNYQHRAEVELAYGRILAAAGQEEEALTTMRDVLYDPLLQGGSLRGEAHVRLAEFYRDVRGDFVLASAHLDTAATALRTPTGTDVNYTRAALTDIPAVASAFNAYAQVAARLAEADSLLELGLLDDEAFAARIREIEAQRLEAFRQEQRRLAETRAEQEFAAGGSGLTGGQQTTDPTAPAQTAEAGFLSYRVPASVEANRLAFQRIWGDRPLVPNWRRQSAVEASVVATDVGGGLRPSTFGNGFPGGGPPPLDLTPIPRTPSAQIALRAERASLRYEAANALFLSLSRPDSAAVLYTLALEDGGSEDVARQIRFALAEVEASRGRSAEAEALYREIIDEAPETALADAARLRLGIAVAEEEAEVDPTSVAYERARERWREGNYATAVGDLLALAADSTSEAVAPRALLAAATAYAEWAQRDSFDVLRPLPASVLPNGLFPEPAATDSLPGAPSPTDTTAASPKPDGVTPRIGAIPDVREADEPQVEAAPSEQEAAEPQRAAGVPDKPQRPRPADRPDEEEREDALDPERLANLQRLMGTDELDEPDEEVVAALRAREAAADTVDTVSDEIPPASRRPVYLPDTPVPPVGAEDVRDEAPAPTVPLAAPAAAPVVAPEPGGPPTIDDVLALVIERAPESPYAQRAQALRQSLRPEPASDAASQPGVTPPTAGAAGGTYGLEGDAPIDPEAGGFAWRAQRIESPLSVIVTLNALARRGIRAGAIRDGDAFRLVLGQFATRPEAFALRADLPPEVEAPSASVIPLAGLTLLTADELEQLSE